MIDYYDMLESAKRELALRQSCYPRWVQQGRLSKCKAEHEIACMREIILTLQSVIDTGVVLRRKENC